MISKFASAAIAALLALLAGCAGPGLRPPAPATGNDFALSGRISVTHGAQNLSGKIEWLHTDERDRIALASPLGNQLALLERDARGVVLTDSSRQEWRAADAESLTEKTLGWRLPLSGLVDWVRGRPLVDPAADARRNAGGQLIFLAQSDWRIEFAYPDAGDTADHLPRRLFMRYLKSAEPLEIRLVIDEWGAP